MFCDSHAHLDDSAFDQDRIQIINDLYQNNIKLVINPSSDIKSSNAARILAEKYSFIYFAAGIHPQEADKIDKDDYIKLIELIQHPKCVAIGEIGLDYHYPTPAKEIQRKIFYEQLNIAKKFNKPVIIHDRDAHEECFEAVKKCQVKGVFHCFSGSLELAKELIKIGFYISFTGAITFKNARKAPEVAISIPLDKLLIETDSPYMTPEPNRGKRNEPKYIYDTARKIAELKCIPIEEVANITYKNSLKLFNILN